MLFRFGNRSRRRLADPNRRVGKDRPFTLYLRKDTHRFNRVHTHYDEAEESDLVIQFNERGNMEIALNRSNAAGLLGLKLFDSLRIEFHDRR